MIYFSALTNALDRFIKPSKINLKLFIAISFSNSNGHTHSMHPDFLGIILLILIMLITLILSIKINNPIIYP